MTIAIVATESQKTELLAQGVSPDVELVWLQQPAPVKGAIALIDLMAADAAVTPGYPEPCPPLVLINAVTSKSTNWPADRIRINAWPGFLKGPVVEATGGNAETRKKVQDLLALFNRKPEWVTDQPGLISARVVCAIINEAYWTLQEKVSSKEDIDTAMRLGTNYPLGPFEWAQKIGLSRVHRLLSELSQQHERYQPAALLTQEAHAEK